MNIPFWKDYRETVITIATVIVGIFVVCCGIYACGGGYATDNGVFMKTNNLTCYDNFGPHFSYEVKLNRSMGNDRTLFESLDKYDAIAFYEQNK